MRANREITNDGTIKLYVTNGDKRKVTRNSVSQFGCQLVAIAEQNDNLGMILDPDAIAF